MYTRELFDKICAELAEGRSLRSVLRADGMPSIGTFLQWVDQDKALADHYARARALCIDALAEDILDIADTPKMGTKSVSKATGLEITEGDMIEHRRLQVDARKWLLAKMAPKKYGDKVEQTHLGLAEREAPVIATPHDEAL